MAKEQQKDSQIQDILPGSCPTSLVLQPLPVGQPQVTLHWDMQMDRIRPFVPKMFRRVSDTGLTVSAGSLVFMCVCVGLQFVAPPWWELDEWRLPVDSVEDLTRSAQEREIFFGAGVKRLSITKSEFPFVVSIFGKSTDSSSSIGPDPNSHTFLTCPV
ncbi:hypothetical protein TNCT_543721 [Trichonephila clavata]|uniref:Uncharacterized protein n=1 Tax=Trichonephila clavata TaxID=2740835 RepID=A0A8X6KTF9_TRICU|nr:hypothetical protein TNCT_543721 [Trichonephila clavata]